MDPFNVGHPRVRKTSFTATGTPSRTPAGVPLPQRAADWRAWARAPSASTRQKALTTPSWRSTRASAASVTSTGDSWRERKRRTRLGGGQQRRVAHVVLTASPPGPCRRRSGAAGRVQRRKFSTNTPEKASAQPAKSPAMWGETITWPIAQNGW